MPFYNLLKYKKKIDKKIEQYLLTIRSSALQEPISYSLCSGGKRLRPLLTMLMSEAIGKKFEVEESALAIEFFHTASLIADDLPCMDDDDYRRGKQSLHTKYGESTALLASFALLTEGFSQVAKNGREYFQKGYGSEQESDKRVRIAVEETAKLSGPQGVILGQYHDIEQTKTDTEDSLEELYYLKTGTLFQGAFTLGFIFGGGDLSKLHLIEKVSRHLGLAFQIRDDFEDIEEECMSFVKKFGPEYSQARIKKEIEGFYNALDLLDVKKEIFHEMITLLFQGFLLSSSQKEKHQTSPRVLL